MAKVLTAEGRHDDALSLLRMVSQMYSGDMRAKVEWLIEVIERRRTEELEGGWVEDPDDPHATRRIPKLPD